MAKKKPLPQEAVPRQARQPEAREQRRTAPERVYGPLALLASPQAAAAAVSPLALNCQAVATFGGLVTGVKLGITPVPGATYEVAKVELIPEALAGGQHVAKCFVYDKAGLPTAVKVKLAWAGPGPVFEGMGESTLTGEHNLTNPYDPNNAAKPYGPLALVIGEPGAWQSDIVWGLGLPWGHHIAFVVVFRELGGIVTPGDDPRIAKFETWAKAVSAKYPGGPQYG